MTFWRLFLWEGRVKSVGVDVSFGFGVGKLDLI